MLAARLEVAASSKAQESNAKREKGFVHLPRRSLSGKARAGISVFISRSYTHLDFFAKWEEP